MQSETAARQGEGITGAIDAAEVHKQIMQQRADFAAQQAKREHIALLHKSIKLFTTTAGAPEKMPELVNKYVDLLLSLDSPSSSSATSSIGQVKRRYRRTEDDTLAVSEIGTRVLVRGLPALITVENNFPDGPYIALFDNPAEAGQRLIDLEPSVREAIKQYNIVSAPEFAPRSPHDAAPNAAH